MNDVFILYFSVITFANRMFVETLVKSVKVVNAFLQINMTFLNTNIPMAICHN